MNAMRIGNGLKGFTLLEVIVTMTIAAILATILVSFMGSSLTGSVTPLLRVQNAGTLSQVFENITADYNKRNADDVGNNTSVALSNLKTNIENGSDPYYGPYTIVYNDYIYFDGGIQKPDTTGSNKVLKVTLRHGDQTITTLFTK